MILLFGCKPFPLLHYWLWRSWWICFAKTCN